MNDNNCSIFNWNVRGLNSTARQQVVRDLITTHRCTIACLQETKLAVVDDTIITNTLGQQFVGSYAFLPAQGIRGGVIIACSQDYYTMQSISLGQFSVSATITNRANNATWSLPWVYGPQQDHEKIMFINEIRATKQQMHPCWAVMGDFNLIYRSLDKNNDRINRSMMQRFKSALDFLELKAIHLHGRKYTWSSETDNPTLSQIDHMFCTRDW